MSLKRTPRQKPAIAHQICYHNISHRSRWLCRQSRDPEITVQPGASIQTEPDARPVIAYKLNRKIRSIDSCGREIHDNLLPAGADIPLHQFSGVSCCRIALPDIENIISPQTENLIYVRRGITQCAQLLQHTMLRIHPEKFIFSAGNVVRYGNILSCVCHNQL